MPNAARDENRVPSLLGVSSSDGATPVTVYVDPTTHRQLVDASVTIAANSSVNLNQIGGNAVDSNSGNKGTGTLRVVLATDQPQLTNALKVDGSAVTQPISAASLPLPTGAATSAKQDTGNGYLSSLDTNIQKNLVNLNGLVVKSSQFAVLAKNVLSSPQTVSGNPTVTFDGTETLYFYKPAATASSLFSYNIRTGVLTTLSTSLAEAYTGASIIYANGKLYYTRGGAFNTWSRIDTDGTNSTALTNTNLAVNFACAMVYDGNDTIYMRTNAGFQKFSIAGNSWTTLTAPTGAATEGCALVLVGKDRIYSLRGGGTATFQMYKISNTSGNTDADTWTSKTAITSNVYDGGCLAWGGGNYLYAFAGNGSQNFYRYSLADDSWSTLSNLPAPASTGSNIIATNGGFLCYITEPSNLNTTGFGTSNSLYFFDPTNQPGLALDSTLTGVIGTLNSIAPSKAMLIGASDGSNIQAPRTSQADNVSPWLVLETAVAAYNGSSVDRIRGDITNGLDVDVTRLPALVAGTAIIGKVGIDQTTPGTTNGVQINAALPAGTNAIGGITGRGSNTQINDDTFYGDSLAAGIMSTAHRGWNEFNYDRWRNNVELTFLTSNSRTTTQTQGDQTNYNSKGIKVVLDVTTAGAGSITLSIQGKDSASGKYYTILSGAAVTTAVTNVYTVYPGLTAAANSVANDIIPRVYRIVVTHNNANAITYSVGFNLIL